MSAAKAEKRRLQGDLFWAVNRRVDLLAVKAEALQMLA